MESNTNTKSVDLVRSDGRSYEDVRYGFGTPKGHTFSLRKSQEHPCDVRQHLAILFFRGTNSGNGYWLYVNDTMRRSRRHKIVIESALDS